MKRKLCSGLLGVLLFISTLLLPIQSFADTVHEAHALMDGIVSFQLQKNGAFTVQDWISGELTANAGATSEWYILALNQSRAGYDVSDYTSALTTYLDSTSTANATSRQKYALVLISTGSSNAYITEVLNNSIGQQGIMSWVYGLHLLNNGYTSDAYSADAIINTLLSLQLSDGGWALTGSVSDVDVTAMTLQALAPYYHLHGTALDRAIARLSELQLDSGDYASYGVANPESTAQVITALSALGIDCMTDERFIKNGNTLLDGIAKYRLSDGSFSHTEGGAFNHNATVQVFYSMTAYVRQQNGWGSLYLFDSRSSAVSPAGTEPAGGETIPSSEPDTGSPGGYKPWVSLGIAGLGGIVCLVLLFTKKRHPKNFIAVLAVTAAGIIIVWMTDFQSAEDYYGVNSSLPEHPTGSVTITIRCDTILGRSDADYIPPDGVILEVTEFAIEEGSTVFDILALAAQTHSIHMEYSGSPEMAYISGIGYLYEFDFGDLSGWVYHVNGESPSVGCSEYVISDGDVIEWLYTCELGDDVK